MTHPLIEKLIAEHGVPEISLETHDEFVATRGLNVLFFPGDPNTVADATDVAVVLPELVRVFDGRLNPGVVTDTFGDGKALKHRYGFDRFPALVFLRDGDYVGTITRIQNWGDYLREIGALMSAPPRRPPGIGIPVVTAG